MSEGTYPRPFGAYVLLEHLGRGGMSEVELARRTVDDARFVRFVVIKRIQPRHADDEGFIRMFQDEARINAELQHENIAQVYDFGQVSEDYFLAMEYVPGMNLRRVQRVLAGRGQVPPFRVTLRILADVLAALEYAHTRVDTYGRPMRLVHRDVNPRNVMLSVRGEVKLIDFGVAKSDTKTDQTVGRSMKGKFAYMAPEQVEAKVRVDGRSDIFAVGLVLHELIEGRSPYAGMSEAQIINYTLTGPVPELKVPEPFPDPDFLRAIHDKALAKQRDERYRTAAEMRQDIETLADRIGGLASRDEMVAFIKRVDPDAVRTITQQLKHWRDPESTRAAAVEPVAAPTPPTPVPVEPPPAIRRDIKLALLGGAAIAVLILAVGTIWLNRTLDPPVASLSGPALTPQPPPLEPNGQGADGSEGGGGVGGEPGGDEGDGGDPTLPAATTDEAGTDDGTPEAPTQKDRPTGTDREKPVTMTPPPSVDFEAPDDPNTQTPDLGETGWLSVSSHPSKGYPVYVNGEAVGETPVKLYRLPVGTYSVVIRDPRGGRSWTHTVDITAGRSSMLTTEN